MAHAGSQVWKYDTILLTGGTGTFGEAFIAHMLAMSPSTKIRIYSRDELKQANLRAKYPHCSNLSYLLGDVRDLERLRLACQNVQLVVHAAALKHVPIGEYNPTEVINTNIIGTINVARAALENHAKQAILLSSDKAVCPINLYGATKLVAEKVFVQYNNYSSAITPRTKYAVVRYGNVMGSRGSVLDVFQRALADNRPLPLTNPDMTRFYLTIQSAVNLVVTVAQSMVRGAIVVPQLPAFNLEDLVKAYLGMHDNDILTQDIVQYTGIRPGEKLHEQLVSDDEVMRAHLCDCRQLYFIQPAISDWAGDNGELKPLNKAEQKVLRKYNSKDWHMRLDISQLKSCLEALKVETLS